MHAHAHTRSHAQHRHMVSRNVPLLMSLLRWFTFVHARIGTCSEVLILGETVLDASPYDAPDPSRVAKVDLVTELGDFFNDLNLSHA